MFAQYAQFANRDAQIVSECAGEARHLFHDAAQFVAAQCARREALRKLNHTRASFGGCRATDLQRLIDAFGEPQNLVLRCAESFGGSGDARIQFGGRVQIRSRALREADESILNGVVFLGAVGDEANAVADCRPLICVSDQLANAERCQ